jgi:tetratricopeptide (TPR) repeat protein
LALGHSGLALQDYGEALKRDARNANAYFARGVLHWISGRLPAAEADFRKVIELEPDDRHGYRRLATVMAEANKSKQIPAVYRAAYVNNRERDWALIGWLNGLIENKDYRGTLEICESIAANETPAPVALVLFRGIAEYELKDYPDAIEDFNEVIERDPHELAFPAYEKLYLAYRDSGLVADCIRAQAAFAARNGRQPQPQLCSEGQSQ